MGILLKALSGSFLVFFGLVFLIGTLDLFDWPVWIYLENWVGFLVDASFWNALFDFLFEGIYWAVEHFWPIILIYLGIVLITR